VSERAKEPSTERRSRDREGDAVLLAELLLVRFQKNLIQPGGNAARRQGGEPPAAKGR
jgi:hypothetical protein